MRNAILDSREWRLAACETAGGPGAKATPKIGHYSDRTSLYTGEAHDWNRSARLAAALYVRRHGGADPDFWYGIGAADADRHLSEHQHSRHQRSVQLHRPARRRHGWPHRHVLRAVAAQQRQR